VTSAAPPLDPLLLIGRPLPGPIAHLVGAGWPPIISFGDFLSPSVRIATLGINPSSGEFVKSRCRVAGSIPILREVEPTAPSWEYAGLAARGAVWQACRDYFVRNPYMTYFGAFERPLARVDEGYRARTACHLDLCTLPTAQLWSKLTPTDRDGLIFFDHATLTDQLAASRIDVLFCATRMAVTELVEKRRLGVRFVRARHSSPTIDAGVLTLTERDILLVVTSAFLPDLRVYAHEQAVVRAGLEAVLLCAVRDHMQIVEELKIGSTARLVDTYDRAAGSGSSIVARRSSGLPPTTKPPTATSFVAGAAPPLKEGSRRSSGPPPGNGTSSGVRGPVSLVYSAKNLTFKRALIEALAPADRFRVETAFGAFEMARAEFEATFANVVASTSWSKYRYYVYSGEPPAKAGRYRV
jgi:hypothetical protein